MSQSTLCKHLRTKSMFITASTPEAQDEPANQHPPHCWCNCTLTETGPDDRAVGHQVCQPSRPCFEE